MWSLFSRWQSFDELLDLLGALDGHDEGALARPHDAEPRDADERDDLLWVLAPDDVARRLAHAQTSAHGVLLIVTRQMCSQGGKTAHVAPIEIRPHAHRGLELLHDGLVDGHG